MGDPTEDVIKREIAKARDILRSDGHAASLKFIREKLEKHFPDPVVDPADDGKPKPPPPVDLPEPPKKRGIWFGDVSE